MKYVSIICEGQTEEAFVNHLLVEEFLQRNISLNAVLIGTTGHKGGRVTYDRAFKNIYNLLQNPNFYVTTFFDFYGLSSSFPGVKEALRKRDYKNRQATLIDCWRNRLAKDIPAKSLKRFIPYIQMYEFEALLFSSPDKFAESLGQSRLIKDFRRIRNGVSTPEEINNSPQTAPSKRIQSLMNTYEKVINGPLAAIEIRLDVIREQCLLFNNWLTQLENLPELH